MQKYIGTQYVHKFSNGEEVKYVTCSNEEFKNIKEKPSLEGYEYQYTVGGDEPYYCIVAKVEKTPELLNAHNKMTLLPNIQTFPDYKPHITVEQVVEPVEESNQTYAE